MHLSSPAKKAAKSNMTKQKDQLTLMSKIQQDIVNYYQPYRLLSSSVTPSMTLFTVLSGSFMVDVQQLQSKDSQKINQKATINAITDVLTRCPSPSQGNNDNNSFVAFFPENLCFIVFYSILLKLFAGFCAAQ